jgi:hypothetical protein
MCFCVHCFFSDFFFVLFLRQSVWKLFLFRHFSSHKLNDFFLIWMCFYKKQMLSTFFNQQLQCEFYIYWVLGDLRCKLFSDLRNFILNISWILSFSIYNIVFQSFSRWECLPIYGWEKCINIILKLIYLLFLFFFVFLQSYSVIKQSGGWNVRSCAIFYLVCTYFYKVSASHITIIGMILPWKNFKKSKFYFIIYAPKMDKNHL